MTISLILLGISPVFPEIYQVSKTFSTYFNLKSINRRGGPVLLGTITIYAATLPFLLYKTFPQVLKTCKVMGQRSTKFIHIFLL